MDAYSCLQNARRRKINHEVVLYKRPMYTIFDNYIDTVDGDFVKKLAANYNLYEYGYRAYITAETTPEDREIQLTVFETLMKYGLLGVFASWWESFRNRVRGILK